MSKDVQLDIVTVDVKNLNSIEYNPRKWSETAIDQLKESIEKFGVVDPLIVNGAENRKNIVIGGHFRLYIAKLLKHKTVVVYLNIPQETEIGIKVLMIQLFPKNFLKRFN